MVRYLPMTLLLASRHLIYNHNISWFDPLLLKYIALYFNNFR